MAVQMGIETLFGLPAHPLIVHAAVVLVPLSAIGAVACIHPGVRRRFGILVAVLACIAAVSVWIAAETGEALEEQVDETELVEEHAELGDRMIVWAALLAVSTVAMVGFSEYQRRQDGDDTSAPQSEAPAWHRLASIGLAAFVVITAVGATVMMVDVGHTGAKATWSDEEEGGEGEEREGEREEEEEEEDEDEDEDEEGLAPLLVPSSL